jgi:hypothetical protein
VLWAAAELRLLPPETDVPSNLYPYLSSSSSSTGGYYGLEGGPEGKSGAKKLAGGGARALADLLLDRMPIYHRSGGAYNTSSRAFSAPLYSGAEDDTAAAGTGSGYNNDEEGLQEDPAAASVSATLASSPSAPARADLTLTARDAVLFCWALAVLGLTDHPVFETLALRVATLPRSCFEGVTLFETREGVDFKVQVREQLCVQS